MGQFQAAIANGNVIHEQQVPYHAGRTKIFACLWRSPYDKVRQNLNATPEILRFPVFYRFSEGMGLISPPPTLCPYGLEQTGRPKNITEKKKQPSIPIIKKPIQLTLEKFFKLPDARWD